MPDASWWHTFFEHPDALPLSLFPSEQTTRHEVEGVIRLCRLRRGGHLLDLCCGPGRHLAGLSAAGYRVAGLDHADHMLRLARERVTAGETPARLVRGEAQRLPFGDQSFDGILCLFNSFGYMESDGENAALLAEAARCLRPGATFLLETRSRAHQLAHVPCEVLMPAAARRPTRLRCEYDPERRRLVSTWFSVPEGRRLHYASIRLYELAEIEALYGEAGLRITRTCSDYYGQPFTGQERQLIVLATRA